MKRFWTDVAVDARGIRLDDRPVRTPGRVPLTAPTDALARAIADEWRGVGDTLDPRAMPLTGLANAAIDRIAADPAPFAEGLARYGESDLLCYRAAEPAELVARQAAAWDPPLAWARHRYDVHLEVTTGILHRAQPPATIARLADAVSAYDAWHLAALSPLVTITGSLVLALALAECAITPDDAWTAAELDADWQAERWGEDALAAEARAARRREYDAALRFLTAL
ncbi:ATP12 family chaperone protein [Sphingomonas rubra]|uniref:Chaperone required for the assembly of the F1-ATPase n=1 Tax=Sphingomonas rubra TaxID=634430 RepID=A0A1I5QL33_9SPHN|nr:ATP12 family protein [Sphingomonas rubra]SFP46932.1 Chaperone required for the assembly of the F1-ATPase [Sphingomonas rubra]